MTTYDIERVECQYFTDTSDGSSYKVVDKWKGCFNVRSCSHAHINYFLTFLFLDGSGHF